MDAVICVCEDGVVLFDGLLVFDGLCKLCRLELFLLNDVIVLDLDLLLLLLLEYENSMSSDVSRSS